MSKLFYPPSFCIVAEVQIIPRFCAEIFFVSLTPLLRPFD
jgi:hypothetical protein